MYKLPLLKIVEKTVDFGAISIPFCAINAHCDMGPKNFLFSIIGYILYKIKIFSDPYYLSKKKLQVSSPR